MQVKYKFKAGVRSSYHSQSPKVGVEGGEVGERKSLSPALSAASGWLLFPARFCVCHVAPRRVIGVVLSTPCLLRVTALFLSSRLLHNISIEPAHNSVCT